MPHSHILPYTTNKQTNKHTDSNFYLRTKISARPPAAAAKRAADIFKLETKPS